MRKVTREEWCEALESGKYKQAKGVMMDDDGAMCCLAVACDLVGVPRDRLLNLRSSFIYYYLDTRIGCGGGFASSIRAEGINEQLKALADDLGLDNDKQAFLANLNDEGCSFATIAKHIRNGYKD